MGIHPDGWLADALGSCGIDAREVDVERDDLCQEDVLTFSANGFSDATLVSLAALHLTFPSRFVFSSEDLERAFQSFVSTSPRMLALRDQLHEAQYDWLKARGLSTFEPFDPENESVSGFAGRVEAACGVERGDLLSIQGDEAISIDPKNPGKLSLDDIKTLTALLDRFAPNLRHFVTGGVRE